ncbi:hypothetical protein FF011L_47500 [Roseimaritima multifibrata]|uniref:Uncharacterized protein n=1 Tax=Roseimaritima multifibrata TaxID=1930274 RepID=A0A517MM32_9BACT|nr:DUF4175 family protein [Roseimaritima multifibrata]QDS95948.1 hypothetical protein FF011L_47500 [Roseimaritima multifibrata]
MSNQSIFDPSPGQTTTTPVRTSQASELLLQKVAKVTRQAQLWLRWRGRFLFAAVLLIVVGGGICVDYSVHAWWANWPETFRWGATVTILLVVAWAAERWLWSPLVRPVTNFQVARRIELRFPRLGDRLSSFIESYPSTENSSSQNLPAYSELQRAASDRLAEETAGLDFSQALDQPRFLKTVLVCVAAVVAVGLFFFLRPATASIGVQRLAMPWRSVEWPRQNHLQLRYPERISTGNPVSLQIVDAAGVDLPVDTKLSWRLAEEPDSQQSVDVDLATGEAILDRSQTEESFQVRVQGGDDTSMPWQNVEVVPPAKMLDRRVSVQPPPISGVEAFETEARRFSIPIDSRFRIRIRVDRELQNLVVTRNEEMLTVERSKDGLEFESTWATANEQGTQTLQFEWTDLDGLTGSFLPDWEIDVVVDSVPVVAWTETPQDRYLTSAAVLDVSFTASDNYGLVESGLVWGDGQEAEGDFVLSKPADGIELQRDVQIALDSVPEQDDPAAVLLYAAARDTAGQVGRSEGLRLFLISAEELESRLVEQSEEVLELIQTARNRQQIAMDRTSEAQLQQDVAQREASLGIARAAQQQAVQQIDSGASGALAKAAQVASQAELNQLDSPLLNSMKEIADQLQQTRDSQLAPALQQLEQAAAEESTDSLAATSDLQHAAEATLKSIEDRLAGGLQKQLTAESIREMAATQQRLATATERAASSQSEQEQRERTETLADQQLELARQSEDLQNRLQEMAESAENAAEDLQQWAPRMRALAEQLKKQPASAAQAQAQLAAEMREAAEDFADPDRQSDSSTPLADRASELVRMQKQVADAVDQTLRSEGVESDAAIAKQSDALKKVDSVQEELQDLPLFPEALQHAKQAMESTVARLKRDPLDAQSLADATAAKEWLEQIAQSLQQAGTPSDAKQDPQEPNSDDQNADPQEENGETKPDFPMASIHLMRSMQVRLRDQTQQLEDRRTELDGADAVQEWKRERQELAAQQAELAERLQAILDDQ